MSMNIALVGNPNCGKTTLFNALTGANQHVGNWPGVTVEKKTGRLKGEADVAIVDLPGIYSLSPYTLEEVVARNYLIEEKPDAIINIVDGTNLERNLYLSTQVIELGIPTVMLVNMADIMKKNGSKIDLDVLSKAMGVPVVEISALKGTGIKEATEKAVEVARAGRSPERVHRFSADVESVLDAIESKLGSDVPESAKRFFAIKLFERDARIGEEMTSTIDVESLVSELETSHDDDSESIIVNERYGYITSIIDSCMDTKVAAAESISDKIDKVVTNRILALPIFVVVMFFVYYLSITTIGTMGTDWVNDNLFGDGWFMTGGGEEWEEAKGASEEAASAIEAYVAAAEDAGITIDTEDESGLAASIAKAEAAGVEGHYDAYDDESGEHEIVAVDGAAFEEALAVEEPNPSDYGWWVPGIPAIVGGWLDAAGVDDLTRGLVIDGIIGGVGSVLGFVPQILVLFFLLAFLEGCGYMSRIAFILDRIFRRFGLSGKSFVPMLVATGCGVPGVMASRTIENENDRHMTVMTTTFMPCSAKLPIIALISGAILGGAWWAAGSVYFLGIASILMSGIILKKTKPFAGKPAPFVMELPAYHMPTLGSMLRSMWERGWSFIKKAGTIIFAAAVLIWVLSTFGFTDAGFGAVDDQSQSLLAAFGNSIAWIFAPLGFANWQATAATVTGLIAKENVVATFGILYAGGAGWYSNVQAAYTPLMAYSFMAFNMLCAPCFAAIGAIRREMNNTKWFWAAIAYECGWAYVIALIIYQVGGLFMGEVPFNFFTIAAFVLLAALLFLLFRPYKQSDDAIKLSVNVATE